MTNDRVLVKDQTAGAENGIYVVDTGTWTRAADWDGAYDVGEGTLVYVTDGTVAAGVFYAVTTADPITIGTTSVALAVGTVSVSFLSASTGASKVGFAQSGSGAIAETLESRERWVVSVTDFMSDAQRAEVRSGTVTLDVTEAWQAAHDALPAATGGELWAPHGVHFLNKTTRATQFTISKSNVTLRGAGWGTQLKHTDSGAVTGGIQGVVTVDPASSAVNNVILRDFRVTGPSASTGAVTSATAWSDRVAGVLLHDGSDANDLTDILVENVLVEKMDGICFLVSGAASNGTKRFKFHKCTALNSRNVGFNDVGGANNTGEFVDCVVDQADGYGMELSTSKGLKVTNNVITRTGQAGIGIEYHATNSPDHEVLISGNKINDIYTTGYPNANGIALGQSVNPANTHIVGNSIARIGGEGIVVNLTPVNISILDNKIKDVGKGNTSGKREGIEWTGGTYMTCSGNSIRTNTSGYAMDYGIQENGSGSATNLIAHNNIDGAAVAKITASSPTRVFRGIAPIIDVTSVGNVGVGEDDLISETIAANTVDTNNQTFRITAWGRTAANANNKTVKLYVGDSLLANTGALGANDKDWRIESIVKRTNATNIQWITWGDFNGSLLATDSTTDSGGKNFAAATVVKCTGEATSDNDIIQDGLIIEFLDTQ